MRIAAFTRYGARAASTRQRLLQYLPDLSAAGFEVEWHALLNDDYVRSLATGETYPKARIARAYADRFRQLMGRGHADLLWVYAELLPYLPAFVEELVVGKGIPVVYDLDDAFFHRYDTHPNPLIRGLLGNKFRHLLSRAAACLCGNAYLRDYAVQYCPNSIVLPTVVDTTAYRPERRPPFNPLIIGWIGSPSTWPNVRPLLPLLAEICAGENVRFRVIGAGREAEGDVFTGMDLVEWSEVTEVTETQGMDIGIMPLVDRPFERGKSGYKLIQYMACGLPVVASPIGVNREIVIDGENGFLATTEYQWKESLGRLIDDAGLRAELGANGRKRAEANYSLASQAPRLVQAVRSAVGMTEF